MRKGTARLTTAGGMVLVLAAAAAVSAQATFTPERSPTQGSRTYANARVVSVDSEARTITVGGGGVGKNETFPVETHALQRVGMLKAGEQVVLTLRAGGPGSEVVTHIERSLVGAAAPRAAGGRAAAPSSGPTATASPATRRAPRTAPSPAARPAPKPEPARLPTDAVGPLRDPRQDPNFDPRQNPQRDPRVVPGLSEPLPSPTPTPAPPPNIGD